VPAASKDWTEDPLLSLVPLLLLLLPEPDWLLELLPVPPMEESLLLVLLLPRPEPLRKLFVLFVFEPVPNVPLDEPEPDVPYVPWDRLLLSVRFRKWKSCPLFQNYPACRRCCYSVTRCRRSNRCRLLIRSRW